MSRLAKKPTIVPEKAEVHISGQTVSVKGPAGALTREFPRGVAFALDQGRISVSATKSDLATKALLGTAVAHVRNMLKGVTVPFQKKLLVEGIGFKADVKGSELTLSLGFSHPVKVAIPKDLKVTTEKNVIAVSGADPEMVGRFAAEVRAHKKPEPYKGKGIRYEGEVIRRKQGKKTA